MDKRDNKTFPWIWFLNNRVVTVLLVSLLMILNVLAFSKISFIFTPIFEFIGVVSFPLIAAGLLYYLINPVVDFLETRKMSRLLSIIIVFILIAALLVWGLAVFIPSVTSQIFTFSANVPIYLNQAERTIKNFISNQDFLKFKPQVDELASNLSIHLTSMVSRLSSSVINWASSLINLASQIVVAVIIVPFILFYLLRDGKQLKGQFTQYLPVKLRRIIGEILTEVNNQLANYVRGQLAVAFIVALMFIVFFEIIGLKYGVTLGVLAGILNLIPYLGSFLALIPAVILGLIAGPVMLLKVIFVFILEQTIEGRFVSPLILGSQLNIHPITILFVLLTSGSMFGVWGVLLGIPVYASLKVIIKAVFCWYKEVSGLYTEEVSKKER